MKWLIKKLINPKTLAGYAAEGITKTFNGSKDDTRMKVAKFAAYGQEATRVSNALFAMVNDGSITSAEKDALQTMLTPLFEKALALV